MSLEFPRIVLSALKGGSGKTILSLGLISAWRARGIKVSPFKKGPDFIDSSWLGIAAGSQCYNLDPFLMGDKDILDSFISNSSNVDVSIVEGNRGLYDGINVEGRYSTAQLAKLLKAPVLLILDVSMATRTIAAILKGCLVFDPEVEIAGVILNRVAGQRQESLIRKTIDMYCGTPVLGAVPKLRKNLFPERHMGLVPSQEKELANQSVESIRHIAEQYLQCDEIFEIAHRVSYLNDKVVEKGHHTGLFDAQPPLISGEKNKTGPVSGTGKGETDLPVIGFVRDRAFWFYYPENLEQLRFLGARLVEINAIKDRKLPTVDALYIGGGFPETQAKALSDNPSFRASLKKQIEEGLPVYAECGGFMYLGESIVVEGVTYPMVGIFPIRFEHRKRPQGHGYSVLEVNRSNLFFPEDTVIHGHEFHYSKPVITGEVSFAFRVKRGHGVDGARDGAVKNNALGTYTHIHARGNRQWAKAMVDAALARKKDRDHLKTIGR